MASIVAVTAQSDHSSRNLLLLRFRIGMRVIAKRLGLTNDSERTQHNNVMHAKPDLRVLLKWMIAGSGSVITDVIPLKIVFISKLNATCSFDSNIYF